MPLMMKLQSDRQEILTVDHIIVLRAREKMVCGYFDLGIYLPGISGRKNGALCAVVPSGGVSVEVKKD